MDCEYEDKFLLKYGALEQEFEDLQAENAEVAALIRQAKVNKVRLQAEIKFLKKRAIALRASMRLNEPYYMRHGGGDGVYSSMGLSLPSTGRMVSADGELYAKAFSPQVSNPFSRGAAVPVFNKPQDVVGVLKTSSSKQIGNGNNAPTKKAGKRKISWQDEFAVKV